MALFVWYPKYYYYYLCFFFIDVKVWTAMFSWEKKGAVSTISFLLESFLVLYQKKVLVRSRAAVLFMLCTFKV